MQTEKKSYKTYQLSLKSIFLKSIYQSRMSSIFEDSPAGLLDFKEASIAYLEYVKETNNNPDNENHLVPDIESWATYLGTTRKTIAEYERFRSSEWQDFIGLVKGSLTACKKQLAFRQKIPTVLALFDLTNNSGYVNSSEFKLSNEPCEQKRALSDAELPRLDRMHQNDSNLPHLSVSDDAGDTE